MPEFSDDHLDRLLIGNDIESPWYKSIVQSVREFFNPPKAEPVPAVCIPPGARLRLQDLPARLQDELGVGPVEDVTFTQISAAVNSYRDAVRFSNGREIRLQELREGQRVRVLDLSMAEDLDLEKLREERQEFTLNR